MMLNTFKKIIISHFKAGTEPPFIMPEAVMQTARKEGKEIGGLTQLRSGWTTEPARQDVSTSARVSELFWR